jgi:hypothetical protein
MYLKHKAILAGFIILSALSHAQGASRKPGFLRALSREETATISETRNLLILREAMNAGTAAEALEISDDIKKVSKELLNEALQIINAFEKTENLAQKHLAEILFYNLQDRFTQSERELKRRVTARLIARTELTAEQRLLLEQFLAISVSA